MVRLLNKAQAQVQERQVPPLRVGVSVYFPVSPPTTSAFTITPDTLVPRILSGRAQSESRNAQVACRFVNKPTSCCTFHSPIFTVPCCRPSALFPATICVLFPIDVKKHNFEIEGMQSETKSKPGNNSRRSFKWEKWKT